MTERVREPAGPDIHALRVVVVDDEPDVRLMLSIRLRGEGFDVVGEGANGDEAVEQCERLRPDVVVLDLRMPGTSGFEAIPRLRSSCPEVGVVAYTAVAGDFARNEMRRLKIPLVLKQMSVEPLVRAIREAAASAA